MKEKIIAKTKIVIKALIYLGLIGAGINYGVNEWGEYKNEQVLKEVLVEEIKENLIIINENIWWDKESDKEWGERFLYVADDRYYEALLNSAKLTIFTPEERESLRYLYRGLNNMNFRFTDESSEEKVGHHKYFQKALEDGKYHIKQILEYLGKEQLYKEFELKGVEHTLPNEYIGKTLETYPDF